MMKNIGDKKIIEIKQQKGKKHISIPILSEVESILNLNLGNFPEKMSHQKYNAHLKKLCELAEINQTIYASKLTKRGDKKYRRIKGYYPKCHIVSSHMGEKDICNNVLWHITHILFNANNWTLFRGYVAKIYWENKSRVCFGKL